MLHILRRKSVLLPSVFISLFSILTQLFYPTVSTALPSGPSPTDFSTYNDATDDMVDMFTGDFSYSIPLMEMEGFPVTIGYNAGITMEQDASWVGLGWSLNLGSINRRLRGIPDDFNGSDVIVKQKNIKPNRTVGISFKPNMEFVGISSNADLIPGKLGLYYNSYQGLGFEVSKTLTVPKWGKPLHLSYNSQSGITHSFDHINFKRSEFLSDFSGGLNSRQGLRLNGQNALRELGQHKFTNISGTTDIQIPSTTDAFTNSSMTFKFKSGTEVLPSIFAQATYEGYYTEQKIRQPTKVHPAFGYLHLDKYEGGTGLADFTVMNNDPFRATQPFLPASQLTYDNFSYTGTGIGGSFRLHRSDIGIVSEPKVYSQSEGKNLGIEVGIGTGVQFGANLGGHYSESSSGRWNLGNSLLNNMLKFQSSSTSLPLLESSYLSVNGEMSQEQADLHNLFNMEKISHLPLRNYGYFAQVESKWESTEGNKLINIDVRADKRKNRSTHIKYVRGDLMSKVGLDKKMRNYTFDAVSSSGKTLPYSNIERVGSYRKGHHISSYEITNDGGSRYVYGIPVYNIYYKEASFNVEGNIVTSAQLVDYSYQDASTINKKGKDNFYTSKQIPPYTTTHLLTSVLSNDYVDYGDDGP
ncbi:MAG: hypothetical protein JKX74_00810, partial [Flavobacteriales bacterium]|nr:hypothetical protein [Flavobacteriales bacterium]